MSVDVTWKFWSKIETDHTVVPYNYSYFTALLVWTGSSATSNIPMAMMDADGGAAAKPDGGDIRFTTDAAGVNEVQFDIANFVLSADPADSRAEIWVTLPSLSTSADIPIYLWWGNSSATEYASSATYGRYNAYSGWNMVYHGNGTNTLANSGGVLHTFTNSGTTEVDGKVGKARSFNGVDNFLYAAPLSAGSPNFSPGVTLMGWVKWQSFTEYFSRIIDFGNGSAADNIVANHFQFTNSYRFELWNGNSGTMHLINNMWGATSATWVHFITTYSQSAQQTKTFFNGIEIFSTSGIPTSAVPDVNRNNVYIGKSNWVGIDGFFNGQMDELRIGTTLANATQYAAIAYAAQNSPHTFLRVTSQHVGSWHLKQLRNELANTMLQTR